MFNYESHVETEDFFNNVFSYFQYPTITCPTRFSSTTSKLIDNIFVNIIKNDYYFGLLISDLSDHLPVFYISNALLKHTSINKVIITCHREINVINILKFNEMLQTLQWDYRC